MTSLMSIEIASQPACWLDILNRRLEIEEFFSGTGGRMAFLGCGTSFHMAGAMAKLREAAGLGGSDVFPASESPSTRRYPWVAAVSRSGTTTELIDALDSFEGRAHRLVITAVESSPLAEMADRLFVLDRADEQSVVQTRFATTCLCVMRAHLGHDVASLASSCQSALNEGVPDGLDRVERFVFLGSGWASAIAAEAALKMTEAAGVMCESYPAYEYRHGPMSAAGSGTLIWRIGAIDPSLSAEIENMGVALEGGGQDPQIELVAVQRAAEQLARHRGRDPDSPPHLNRSVILETRAGQ